MASNVSALAVVEQTPNSRTGEIAQMGLTRDSREESPVAVHEAAFLGAILHFMHQPAHDYGLAPETFLVPKHQVIWREIQSCMESGSLPSFQAVKTRAEASGTLAAMGGVDYLYADILTRSGPATDLKAESEFILDAARIREIRAAALQIVAEIDTGSYPSAMDAGMAAEQTIFSATQTLRRGNFQSVADSAEGYRAEFERKVAAGGRPTGIPLGIDAVDSLLKGLNPGTLNALIGESGMGKTGFVTSCLSYFAAQDIQTAVFSLEMPKNELIHRIISSESGVPLEDVTDGNPSTAQAVRGSMDRLNGFSSIHISDESSMTLEQIGFECRRLLAEQGRLDVMVIDHVHIIERAEGYESYLKLTRGLKRLARELGTVIIGLFHLNSEGRNRKNKRPLMSDMKWGGFGDCDAVISLYRDEVYFPEETQEPGIAEIGIPKMRNGKGGVARVRYVASRTLFDDFFNGRKEATERIILPWKMDEAIEEYARENGSTALPPAQPPEEEFLAFGMPDGEDVAEPDLSSVTWDNPEASANTEPQQPAQPKSLSSVLFPDGMSSGHSEPNTTAGTGDSPW